MSVSMFVSWALCLCVSLLSLCFSVSLSIYGICIITNIKFVLYLCLIDCLLHGVSYLCVALATSENNARQIISRSETVSSGFSPDLAINVFKR